MARLEPVTTAEGAPEIAGRIAAVVHRCLHAVLLSGGGADRLGTLARSGTLTPYQLPALTTVLGRIWIDAVSGDLWVNTALTLYRALVGFAICAVLGVLIGVAMSRNVVANWFFDPIVSVGFPMPKIAFLPVVILWLGVYDVAKISIIVIDAIFPVIAATVIAIQGVPHELIWSARNMGANDRDVLRQVILPAASPQIITGLQVVAAALPDRGGGRRDADGRLRARRRDDHGRPLCQFDRGVRRYPGNCGGRLRADQADGARPPPAPDLAPGSPGAKHRLALVLPSAG